MKKHYSPVFLAWRFRFVVIGLAIITLTLIARMAYLTISYRSFLLTQGNARSIRIMSVPAYRGMILDRNGEPLAVSTPIDSVWINPQDFQNTSHNIIALSHALHMPVTSIKKLLTKNKEKQFFYIKRRVNPDISNTITQLDLPGVYLERTYKRYYPTGETTAHVIGSTDIDEYGIDGLELSFEHWLKGTAGKQRVIKDLYGHRVATLSEIKPALPGKDLTLSIDNRIQFIAYRALKATIKKYHAKSGSVVILNPQTGEILAMANQPAYNPNNRPHHDTGQFRNRAVTDIFEPGSTIKVFSVINALQSGKYTPKTLVNTNPGRLTIGHNIVQDTGGVNLGIIPVTRVLKKSSNIGIAKMTLSLPPESLINFLNTVGFGEKTESQFPGEVEGMINSNALKRPFVLATLAFGYGISVTPLQLAAAYSVIAHHGQKCPITLLKKDGPSECQPLIKTKIIDQVTKMLEGVLESGGTGFRAHLSGYSAAGKTGTSRLLGPHGYDPHRHVASFVGFAPVKHPKLVVAITIFEPQGKYYAAQVAAPAFAQIMSHALRILGVTPDHIVQNKKKL